MGIVMGGRFDNRGDRTRRVLGFAMLSVPTLWTVFVINFLALGLIWAYVMRSYPEIRGGAVLGWLGVAAGAAARRWRCCASLFDSLVPLLTGGTMMIFAACLAAMGIKRFYGQPVSWRTTALITGLSFAAWCFSSSATTACRCGS